MKARLSLLSAALLLGLTATGVQAAFQSCIGPNSDTTSTYDIRNKVSTAYDCTILKPLDGNKNDNPMPEFVNTEAFFGITNWLYDGKWDDLTDTGGSEKDDLKLFDFSGNQVSGSFTYNASHGLGDIAKIMFVFKDGDSTNLVGYLVTAAGGSYSTPFTKPPFSFTGGTTAKNISHISVYYQSSSSTSNGGGATSGNGVPEPGVLGLLGLGLLALGALRRRAV